MDIAHCERRAVPSNIMYSSTRGPFFTIFNIFDFPCWWPRNTICFYADFNAGVLPIFCLVSMDMLGQSRSEVALCKPTRFDGMRRLSKRVQRRDKNKRCSWILLLRITHGGHVGGSLLLDWTFNCINL